ncbi:hypothetical protein [Pseudarthrobacter albicanus]|uniref:hypothetical protein n=1 Tax=Pseudarthrobacter albicanus TaxID=2823873 RepID=UPI001BA98FD1|nr:hypothetical protein [Pseudarthrobacter albicanus]
MNQLQAQASGATPAPGELHARKVTLVRVAFLGDVKEVVLPGGMTGYELGIEFVSKLGDDDSRTGRKLCSINLADSSVDWKALA